jgi:hypothetical protein
VDFLVSILSHEIAEVLLLRRERILPSFELGCDGGIALFFHAVNNR